MTNYIDNQIAHDLITEQFQLFKAYETDREERLKFADDLTERFYAQHGEAPSSAVLERLATLILQDELADRDRMKMRNTEFPILSADQEKRRNRGKRSITAAEEIAADGLNYRIKTRDSNRRMRECFGL